MVHSDPSDRRKDRSALLRILKITTTLPAKVTFYASALGAIALVSGNSLPPPLATLAAGVGVNALSSILERIAVDEQLTDEEIRRAVESAVAQSDIAQQLTERDIQISVAKLFRQNDVLHFAIQNSEYDIARRLAEQATNYQALGDELHENIAAVYAETKELHVQGEEIIRLQKQLLDLLARQTMPFEGPEPLPASRLPRKSYRELVGRSVSIAEIMAALRDPDGRWIVAINGMGGIGKTALVHEVADQCIRERLFDLVAWESAAKTEFASQDLKGPNTQTFANLLDSVGYQLGILDIYKLHPEEKEQRMRGFLQHHRALIVLDSLETAAEPQNAIAQRLLPMLGPSKALFTSRHRFEGDLYERHLTGLGEDDSINLIRHEANEKGIGRVATAHVAELKQIADVTGGLPLALKLAVGQLGHLPLEQVLFHLRKVEVSNAQSNIDEYAQLYRFIFLPSWQLLSDSAQKLLISAALFAPGVGGTFEELQATSALREDELVRSINELWRLSLLEVGESDSLTEVPYYLHALTANFVLSDIVQVSSQAAELPKGS